MADRRAVTLWLRPADFGIFLAYVAMLCVFVPFHEPWADEAQAWLLAHELSIHALLFHNLRHEGHPALWYLLLWIPTHLNVSYSLFNWFSAAIASAGIYVLLRFAPFPFYLRALLPFTFFLGYQYSIVARSYVLFPLLGFLVAHLYRLRRPRPVWMAICLALLANVSVHGTIVACAFAALYAWKLWQGRAKGEAPIPSAPLRLAGTIFVGSILFVAICLWPSVGSLPLVSPTWGRIINALSVPASADEIPPPVKVQTPASPPAAAPVAASTAALPAPQRQIPGQGRLASLPFILGFAFAASWWLAVVYDGLLLFYLFRRGELKLALPAALLLLFLVFAYAAAWHLGLLWITGLMILWAAWDDAVDPRTLNPQNAVALSLALLCAMQLPWTFHAFRFDVQSATSPDKETADFLRTLDSGRRVAGFGMSVGVQPYFRRNPFFNQTRRYASFAYDRRMPSLEQVIAEHPDVIVADEIFTPSIEASGYRATHVFCGSLYFPNVPLKPMCLTILEPAPPTESSL
jgi:hypothetical protein